MTTPKKKHLIELMIEAGVEWPEGAKYAAQNKNTMHVRFYEKDKPFRSSNVNYWDSLGGSLIRSVKVKLPELCSNWHQTIVTREQYAKILTANVNEPAEQVDTQQKPQYCTSVMRQMPSETIESLLAEIKAKREEHGEVVVKTKALALAIACTEQQINNKLKEYGFMISPITTPSEPEQPVITNWRDLQVGDVVVVDYVDSSERVKKALEGKESTVVRNGQYSVCLTNDEYPDGGSFYMGGHKEKRWRFIHRP